ncbi:MAG: tRNA guanosine(34) transglycosylase Tgt [Candidatus Colwellbacteria bacterium]|nr:tRNA guanosine(34) transglycosylase Tgt [Candidatus Colwellbacteria bacterium]
MIDFKLLKKSKKSNARLGVLKTPHGEVKTPAFVPVATQATVKTLRSDDLKETGTQLLIANTYHLHLKPGEKLVKSHGGIHKFANIDLPVMTDSGGFQVLSLGFGRDYGIGKIMKYDSGEIITKGSQPKLLKITEDGVEFTSYVDGKKIFMGPKESIKIQESIGADIIFAFDEPTVPTATEEYTAESVERTHRWADACLKARKTNQALYGITQGGRYKDLRIKSAKFIASRPFDGFGIGGEYGSDKRQMVKMIEWVTKELPENKPRHLLGVGYLEDMEMIVKAGVDTFDCTVPTHYARHGNAFTSKGKVDLTKTKYLSGAASKQPLDPECGCFVCREHTKGYLSHLIRAHEITGLELLSFHNVYYFNKVIEGIRKRIKKGEL